MTISRLRLLQAPLASVAAGLRGQTTRSVVAMGHDARLRTGSSAPDSARLLALLDRCVQRVYGRDTPLLEAWKQVARRGEVVGLKVN